MIEIVYAYKDLLTAMLAIAGLLWAIGSFYWLHWRKGKLVVSGPRSYMAAVTSDKVIVDLPLVFYNDGAAPIVIHNLNLELSQGGLSILLRFNSTRDKLGAEKQNWATQIAVEGRKSFATVCSFQTRPNGDSFKFQPGRCQCILWGRLEKSRQWQVLLRFELAVEESAAEKINSGRFLAYDNYADERPRLH